MPPTFHLCEAELSTLREVRCSHCDHIFYLCRQCDHGQTYCSVKCRVTGQRQLRRLANQRHQRTREGRRDHADRQSIYRASKKVTDQGRPPLEDSGKVCASEEEMAVALVSTPAPSVIKDLHESPTLPLDPILASANSPVFPLRDPRASACGPAPTLPGAPSGRRPSAPNGWASTRKTSIVCAGCGREGRFIRTGPLRRSRLRP
jgi:hypothetical protein